MNKYNISAYDEKNQTGDIRHIFIRTNYESSILICIISTKEKIKHYDKFILDLKTNNINLCGLVLNQNKEKTNVIFGKKFITLYGSYSINEKLCEIKYKLSVPSFFQINRVQAEILYNKALSYANPNPNDIVLDLYCGIGAITLLFARKCRHTIGIEIVKDAIDNAFINAKINNINNVEFICSDATEIACKFAKENYQPDIICVDPPRKGLTQKVIEAILKMSPSKIIYISCNPATFARDINEFDNNSYKLLKAEMVDMFPRTHHIEIVSLLIKQ